MVLGTKTQGYHGNTGENVGGVRQEYIYIEYLIPNTKANSRTIGIRLDVLLTGKILSKTPFSCV